MPGWSVKKATPVNIVASNAMPDWQKVTDVRADPNVVSWYEPGLVVIELAHGRRIDQSATSDTRTRSFLVKNALSIDTIPGTPGLPEVGQEHPFNPFLMVTNRVIEPVEEAPLHFRVVVTYDYPRLTEILVTDPRVNWNVGQTQQRWEVDLDGLLIGTRKLTSTDEDDGNLVDEDATIGVDVMVADVQFDVAMPVPTKYHPSFDEPYWMCVNSAPFFGLSPGYCQYIGSDARWVGPEADDYDIVRRFRAGRVKVPAGFAADVGGDWVSLEYATWFEFKKQEGSRVPVKLRKSRIYERKNLDYLLQVA